jgi:hypothetical protein
LGFVYDFGKVEQQQLDQSHVCQLEPSFQPF